MYEAFFGFNAKPFQLNPDPSFFYGSRGHKRAMAYLEYGLHQGEGFIVITGEVGAGKTTLVRNLLNKIPSGEKIHAAQIVSSQLDANDLLKMVAAGYGIAVDGLDKPSLLLRLESTFQSFANAGQRALLVVDEAQNLSPRAVEELRMLSNFQIGNTSLLQSFLIGQPEFREVMQRPEMKQLKQRVIASYHLGPLDKPEIKAYVEHRLNHAGWSGKPIFEDDCFEKLADVTAGIPRRINTLCDRLLLSCFLTDKYTISASDVDEISNEIADELGAVQLVHSSISTSPNWSHSQTLRGGDNDQALLIRLSDIDRRLQVIDNSILSLAKQVNSLATVTGAASSRVR